MSSSVPANPVRPRLSVVVACTDCRVSLERVLAALAQGCEDVECDVLVVDALAEGSTPAARQIMPRVTFINRPRGSLVPQLWAAGITEASGDAVALTVGNCVVPPGWGRAMVDAIAAGAGAAGGPLALDQAAGAIDAAVFFLRYSAFLDSSSGTDLRPTAIAGDNSIYSRAALDNGGWNRDHGFWETEVNALLLEKAFPIAWVPAATAVFLGGVNARDFIAQRFQHGFLFGQWRVKERHESRARLLLAAPLVPIVMLIRTVKRVWPHREYRSRLLSALPFLACFAISWAAGEARGALVARVQATGSSNVP